MQIENTEIKQELENEFGDIDNDVLDTEAVEDTIEDDEADVELLADTIERIKSMFDAGSTKSVIAKELGISRADVIEVLGKYVGRNKINGKNTQTVDFVFDPTGKTRVELGDRLNTSVYIKDGDDVEAVKTKWLKVIGNKND